VTALAEAALSATERNVKATTAEEAAKARAELKEALAAYLAAGGCPDWLVRAARLRGASL
jgi:hypothetical protein